MVWGFAAACAVWCLLGCAAPSRLPPGSSRQPVTASCGTARSFGAVPDDGSPAGAALTAASAACAGGALEIEAGTYLIQLAPVSWGYLGATLVSSLHGVEGKTTLRFVGDSAGRDVVGLVIAADHVSITGIRFDGDGVTGVNEHSPLVQVRGPNVGFELAHSTCSYPVLGARGDCLQTIGYAPDRLVSNVHVHHNVVEHAARVGFAFHSGTTGEIDHNTFLDGGRAADLDGEGSGGSKLRIHHNTIVRGPHTTSVVGINIMYDDGHEIYDNTITGKVLNLYGCAHCDVHDNHVTLDVPTGAPVLTVTKLSPGYRDHDNTYERSAAAGPGVVVSVAQRITAPSDVTFDDDAFAQYTGWVPIQSLGISGLAIRHARISYYGVAAVAAWDAEGIANRTTGLVLEHSTLIGGFSAVLTVGGSYGGTGSVTVTGTSAPRALRGLVCGGVAVGAGVLGPVTYADNTMPEPVCGGLTSP
jgi:hypothetical protein